MRASVICMTLPGAPDRSTGRSHPLLGARWSGLAWAVAFLALSAAALLAIFHLGGPGLDLGDYSEVYGRHRHFLVTSLRQHSVFPLWNPYNFSGHPFIGDLLLAPFYPTMLLYLVLPEPLALFLDLALHMAAGGLGMRALCGRLGIGTVGAAAAGLFYLTLPSWIGHAWAGHLQHIQAIAWIPWLLWTTDQAVRGSLRKAWLPGVASAALLTGGGGVPIAWMTLLFLPLWLLLRTPPPAAAEPVARLKAALRQLFPRLLALAASLLTGLLLSAANWLPAVFYTRECGRSTPGVEWVAQDALTLMGLLAAAVPDLLSRAAGARYVVFEWYGYPGLLVLVAAALALTVGRARGLRLALLVPAFLAVILATGPTFGLAGLLSATVPGYGFLRCHCRELTLALVFLLPLAGAGIQALWEHATAGDDGLRPALWTAGGALALLALVRIISGSAQDSGAEWVPWTSLALALGLGALALRPRPGVLVALLLIHGLDVLAPARGLARFADLDLWRFSSLEGADQALLDDDSWYRYWSHEEVINANHGVDIQRRSVTGYENQFPIRYGRYFARLAGLEPDAATTHLSPGLIELVEDPFAFELLGLRYAILPERAAGNRPPPPPPGAPPPRGVPSPPPAAPPPAGTPPGARAPGSEPAITRPSSWILHQHPDPMPRAVLLSEWDTVADGAESLEAVVAPSFDPRARAVLETEPRWPALPDSEPSAAGGVLSVEDQGPNRLRVEVEAAAPSLLVLCEMFHPGWRASVDGVQAEVLRADYLLRAVPVPAGRHSVTMAFRPPGLLAGLLVSLLALIAALALPRLRLLARLEGRAGSA